MPTTINALRSAMIAAFAALCLSATPSLAAAPSFVGTVDAVSGAANLLHAGDAAGHALQKGTKIAQGDTIETSDNARVHIVFIDKTDLTVSSHGRIVIDDFVYDPQNTAANKADISIFGAAFSYVGGLVEKHAAKPNVHVNLDFGSVGIRGTRFSRTMRHMQCWIYLEQGAITVSNNGGTVDLKPGQGTIMDSRQSAPVVKLWSPREVALIKSDATGTHDTYNK